MRRWVEGFGKDNQAGGAREGNEELEAVGKEQNTQYDID